ncbi:hypothetical protein ACTJK5_12570 [Agrobacterium sp. 22094]|uniref:hypothetical protein n=1 Tax=Agrobacterium sp. 22094 TaxID=3453872 RepID=UPI003F8374C8
MKVYESALTEANLKSGHIYITSFRDQLPPDVFGGSTRNSPPANRISLEYEDLRIDTYVPTTEDGAPRNFFQNRSFVRTFFEDTGANLGDVVVFQQLSPYQFRLSLRKAATVGGSAPPPVVASERSLATRSVSSNSIHNTSRVFIANFGRGNWAWPSCLERGAVATMMNVEAFEFWKSGNREGFIEHSLKGLTAAGATPTRSVASRWYNLMSAIAETEGDIWIHREKDQLWWTKSLAEAPIFERQFEPLPDRRDVIVCFKACEPWRNVTFQGHQLLWRGLHPKGREFLFTEGTLQQLSSENAEYAMALVQDLELEHWHQKAAWRQKIAESKSQAEPLSALSALDKSVLSMVQTAKYTTSVSNGQMAIKFVKNKDLLLSDGDLERLIRELIEMQDQLCALSGLPLQFLGMETDKQMLASLDRIDSNGQYAKGNLQVVCRFINKWKSDMPNPEFRRLMDCVQDVERL